MKSMSIALGSAAALVVGAGSVLAGNAGPIGEVNLTFFELANEGGITVSGTDYFGNFFNGPTITGETYRVGVPYTGISNDPVPDFRLSHIGVSQNLASGAGYYLINIYEPGGTDLSDQLYIYRDGGNNTHIDFYSDPNDFVTLNPSGWIIEDGTVQFGMGYQTDQGSFVNIWFMSDLDVPSPGAAALLGIGGLMMTRRRR